MISKQMQTRIQACLLVAGFSISLVGCSTSLKDYKGTSPEFAMDDFLHGDIVALGMIQDYTGKVIRRFCVDINGEWRQTTSGNLEGTISEIFYYDDGEQDQRVWKIQKQQKNGKAFYTGTAGDVIGTAAGQSEGYAFFWEYTLEIPMESGDGEANIYRFKIKDWIFQLDETRAINRTSLKKFGVEVGQLTIFFDKNMAGCTQSSSWGGKP